MVASHGRSRFEAVPEVVLGLGLTWFLLDETDAATSAFRSVRAVGLMAAAGIAWLVARVVAARFVRPTAARLAIFGAAALAVLVVVVLPAYDDDTVVERLDAAPAAPASATPAAPAPEPGSAPSRVRLRTGPFHGIDHRAEGTVTIYRDADGRHVVGLEDFDIQPGPDYDVYAVPGRDRRDRAGGVRLDDLRGNRGTQYYDVPVEADLANGAWTVLVWCQTFGVPVANATPA